jgi:ubiquinone/menaquinone biosynthesis C-methylase UbiE
MAAFRRGKPLPSRQAEDYPITRTGTAATTAVENYWSEVTVCSTPFNSAEESLNHLAWRFNTYHHFQEFMGLYGRHRNQVVLDYGCGPGNDLVGYLVNSRARQVIGVDVSDKALHLARARLALHRIDPARVRLIRTCDADSRLPLEANSVDHIYCEGVLHHTTDPVRILREFYRVLRPGKQACIMVYNRDSIWRNLTTAHVKMILEGKWRGLTVDEAFAQSTDGEGCPIARCYSADEFTALCRPVGFTVAYRGGYLAEAELTLLAQHGEQARNDPRMPEDERRFLRALTYDRHGHPLYGANTPELGASTGCANPGSTAERGCLSCPGSFDYCVRPI